MRRMMRALALLVSFLWLSGAVPGYAASPVGTWRNLSFNVDGAGGRQSLMRPLMVRADHSYTWGREHGQWSVRGGGLYLSARPAWGAGRLNHDGQLVFQFVRQSKHFVVTMYRAGEAPDASR